MRRHYLPIIFSAISSAFFFHLEQQLTTERKAEWAKQQFASGDFFDFAANNLFETFATEYIDFPIIFSIYAEGIVGYDVSEESEESEEMYCLKVEGSYLVLSWHLNKSNEELARVKISRDEISKEAFLLKLMQFKNNLFKAYLTPDNAVMLDTQDVFGDAQDPTKNPLFNFLGIVKTLLTHEVISDQLLLSYREVANYFVENLTQGRGNLDDCFDQLKNRRDFLLSMLSELQGNLFLEAVKKLSGLPVKVGDLLVHYRETAFVEIASEARKDVQVLTKSDLEFFIKSLLSDYQDTAVAMIFIELFSALQKYLNNPGMRSLYDLDQGPRKKITECVDKASQLNEELSQPNVDIESAESKLSALKTEVASILNSGEVEMDLLHCFAGFYVQHQQAENIAKLQQCIGGLTMKVYELYAARSTPSRVAAI